MLTLSNIMTSVWVITTNRNIIINSGSIFEDLQGFLNGSGEKGSLSMAWLQIGL